MSKGEFDSPSKAATDEYRENWERLWGNIDALAMRAAASTRLKFSPDGKSFEFLSFRGNGGPGSPVVIAHANNFRPMPIDEDQRVNQANRSAEGMS